MEIELDLDKNVDQNASIYFEKAKRQRKKIDGIKKAILKAKERIDAARKEKETRIRNERLALKERSRKREWYEKFRWFISSDGFIVIGGKDASSNEAVVKKHMDEKDIVFHTESPGSPFVIVKNPEGREVPVKTREEASSFALTFSKAFGLGIGSAEVMEVSPSQVTKHAKAGEYISKGSFMIIGKRKLSKPKISLAVGILEDSRVMGGPQSAVGKWCTNLVKLRAGEQKKGETAKLIMRKLGLHTNDDIISCLPSGRFGIEK